MGKAAGAYLTVFLALCLTAVVALYLTLLDGVRRNGARLEAECVTDIGLQSIMAEYHRELMRRYNLFAIDSSYGTDVCGKSNTEEHLRKYLERNMDYGDIFLSGFLYKDFFALHVEEVWLTKVSILTDGKGEVFRKCAIGAVKADAGLDYLRELRGWLEVIEVNGLEEGAGEAEKQKPVTGIEETDWENLGVENPAARLEEKRRLGILKLVVEDEESLSRNVVYLENLVQNRLRLNRVNQGNMEREPLAGGERILEQFLFQEYLLQYMGRYGEEEEGERALRYQMEYLVAGKESDLENLRSVANRICVIREAANATYLLSDKTKRQEIKLAAELICALIALPELTPIVEGAILLGWAYAESVYDVKTIMEGGRIPLLKDDESWHYGLEKALAGDLDEKADYGKGLGYEDYLRIFMMMTDLDTLTARAMDMVEADIRKTPGNSAFRLDGCFEAVEACVRIDSAYGYRYEIIRGKNYGR